MFQIDVKSSIPIFEQLIQSISKYIALGILGPNEKLPSVRGLAKELGVNPNTIAKAYQECEVLGLIYSQPGVGSFVSDKDSSLDAILQNAYKDLNESVDTLLNLGETKEDILSFLQEVKK